MPTVNQLLDRVRRILNYKYENRDHFIDLFNDALNQLTDGAKLVGSADISVVAGTSAYDLPSAFKAPISLVKGSIAEASEVYTLVNIDEFKYGYAIFNGQIHIKPTPNEDKTLTLFYYKYATQLEDSEDVPEIDSVYHNLLPTYAALMVMLMPDLNGFDKGIIDRLRVEWDEGKKSFKTSMMQKNKRSGVNERVVW